MTGAIVCPYRSDTNEHNYRSGLTTMVQKKCQRRATFFDRLWKRRLCDWQFFGASGGDVAWVLAWVLDWVLDCEIGRNRFWDLAWRVVDGTWLFDDGDRRRCDPD
jgi:hypothetical protein